MIVEITDIASDVTLIVDAARRYRDLRVPAQAIPSTMSFRSRSATWYGGKPASGSSLTLTPHAARTWPDSVVPASAMRARGFSAASRAETPRILPAVLSLG